ncbi:uncharacterized protein [Odocoileus virginianus]|uniref:Ig-like domain-containing protein n=1 Tax=Odocoileus virginianus TaxID=9874 RepID=A0ABM4I5Y3_ODOVR
MAPGIRSHNLLLHSLYDRQLKGAFQRPSNLEGGPVCRAKGILDEPPNVMRDVRIPEREERRPPRQCNSQKGKFIADFSQGSCRIQRSGARSESHEPKLLHKFIRRPPPLLGLQVPGIRQPSPQIRPLVDHSSCPLPSLSKSCSIVLTGICSTGVKSSGAHGSGVQDFGAHVPLQRIRGGSVLFLLTKYQEAVPEEVSWGFGPESNYRVLLRVRRGADPPTWVSLQDKYQHRVHVPNVTSLRIENLTPEDSGEYRSRADFPGGMELTQVFLLTVYDPAPLPQILVKSTSITPGWCNATLECTASRDTEDLKVTWGSMGLPREQRIMLDPPSDSWTLTLSLPLSRPSASLTCVVSNQVDQKAATLDLGEVCVSDSHGQVSADPLSCIIKAVVVMLLILGVGLFFWKTCGKKRKMKTGRGIEFQEDHRDNDGGDQYAELSQQAPGEATYKVIGEHT